MTNVTPDIQVSRDNQHWFSIYKPQEMMIFAALTTNIELHASIPMFYMRVAPKKDVQDYTPSMAIRVGPGQPKTNGLVPA